MSLPSSPGPVPESAVPESPVAGPGEPALEIEHDLALRAAAERLGREFTGIGSETVEIFVHSSEEHFAAGARIPTIDDVRTPRLPGHQHEHWDLPDPSGRDLDTVRMIRDETEQRVRDLLVRLGVGLSA
ncbi:hypothetical protein [Jiangella endophytica]|uniref:hypothetical protein n=1 Tax=Jiangella endophytica TaxID=1623398 RepID=UPI0018E4F3FB|nr:hypothetical protein [Jiangella endophytica]